MRVLRQGRTIFIEGQICHLPCCRRAILPAAGYRSEAPTSELRSDAQTDPEGTRPILRHFDILQASVSDFPELNAVLGIMLMGFFAVVVLKSLTGPKRFAVGSRSCGNCGQRIPDIGVFCPFCGQRSISPSATPHV